MERLLWGCANKSLADKNDGAVIIGVSKQDHIPEHSVGHSAENDARVMFDICKIQLGMKPNRFKISV